MNDPDTALRKPLDENRKKKTLQESPVQVFSASQRLILSTFQAVQPLDYHKNFKMDRSKNNYPFLCAWRNYLQTNIQNNISLQEITRDILFLTKGIPKIEYIEVKSPSTQNRML